MCPPNDVKALATARRVVVGVDGSSGSLAGLRWAGREAISCGLDALAVIAWQFPVVSRAGHGVPRGEHPGVVAEEVPGVDPWSMAGTSLADAASRQHRPSFLIMCCDHCWEPLSTSFRERRNRERRSAVP